MIEDASEVYPPLLERLVLAAVEAHRDGDPQILIAIGTNEVQITWPGGGLP